MEAGQKLNVLVYGATGSQSSAVVHHLLARGHRPFVFTRQRDKAAALEAAGGTIVVGDMTNAEQVRTASKGMDAIVLLIPFGMSEPLLAGRNAVNAAQEAGVKLMVWNTSGYIPPVRTGNTSYDVRIDMAAYLRNLALPHITLVPTVYTENLLGPWTAPSLAGTDELAYPLPASQRVGWLPHADLGALTVAALERPELAGSVFTVSGTELLTGDELAARFTTALGRPVRYRAMPADEFESILRGFMDPAVAAEVAKSYQQMWDDPAKHRLFGIDMQPVLEKLPVRMTPLQEWVQQNAAAFS
jgi:uncharacterized protein YbjT (DUF2867 family)